MFLIKICKNILTSGLTLFVKPLSLLFLLNYIVFSFDSNFDLKGIVIDNSNQSPVSYAKIKIESYDSKFSKEVLSDAFGNYSFNNIPNTTYILSVSRLGYEKYEIKDLSFTENEHKVFNIYLTPKLIEIDKINVTATKTEVTLKQTPSSISILNSDEIKNRNFLTFDDALSSMQGVSVFKTSGINVQGLSIRGSSDVAGGGIGNRVLLLLDGRPSLTGDSKGALWSLIPLSIIERTEVVKGAFSSLYGSSAIGGVINVITKKPAYKSSTIISSNFGFYEKLNDSLKFTNSLRTFSGFDLLHSNTLGKFAYMVNFNYNQNEGHRMQSGYTFYSGFAKIMYDVINNRDLEITLQYTKSKSDFPRFWRKDPGGFSMPYWVADYYRGDKITKESQSADIVYTALPNKISKYNSRFYFYKLNSISFYNPKNPVAILFAGENSNGFETFITSYNFGNINQIDFQLSKRNYLIFGSDIQWNVVRSSPEEILYGNQQQNNFGIFIQNQYKIIANNNNESILSFTSGLRADYNKFIGFKNYFQLSPKISFLFNPDLKNNSIFGNTSFRFLIGRAFRAPSIAELYFKKELFGGFDFIFNPNLKPEEMISAEIGFRKQYKNKFIFDISAYFNLYDNLIQYVNVGEGIYGPFQVQNIAKSQIKGIEFQIDYNNNLNLLNNLFNFAMGFNYSLIDARDISNNRKDDFLPYKPKHILNFTIDFSYLGFKFNLTGKYSSKIDEVLFYKYEEPEKYFTMDLKLSKNIFKNTLLFLAVNNLLNTSYQELERTQAPNRNFNSGIRIEF